MQAVFVLGAVLQGIGISAVVVQIAFVQAKQARTVLGEVAGAGRGLASKVRSKVADRIGRLKPGPRQIALTLTAATASSAAATLTVEYANDQTRAVAELQQQVNQLCGRVEALEARAAEPHDSIADQIADIRRLGWLVLGGGAFASVAGLVLMTWAGMPPG